MGFWIIFHRINCFGQMPGYMGMDPASSVSFSYSLLLLKLIRHMVLAMTCHLLGYPFHHPSNKGIVKGIYAFPFNSSTQRQSGCIVGWSEGVNGEDRNYYLLYNHWSTQAFLSFLMVCSHTGVSEIPVFNITFDISRKCSSTFLIS